MVQQDSLCTWPASREHTCDHLFRARNRSHLPVCLADTAAEKLAAGVRKMLDGAGVRFMEGVSRRGERTGVATAHCVFRSPHLCYRTSSNYYFCIIIIFLSSVLHCGPVW